MFKIPQNSFEIRQTEKKGRGVFATKEIKSGTVIGDYVGKVMPYEEVDEEDYLFLMYLNDKEGIVANKNEVGVHLLNHSCNPNCLMEPTTENIRFVSIKNIKPGEELTISYKYPAKEFCDNCTHECFCGEENCTGSMHPIDITIQGETLKS